MGIGKLREAFYFSIKRHLMFIVVNHTIFKTENFWSSSQELVSKLPHNGVRRLVNTFPNETMDRCICIWEAESIECLNEYLTNFIGEWSRQSYFQINEEASVGLNKELLS